MSKFFKITSWLFLFIALAFFIAIFVFIFLKDAEKALSCVAIGWAFYFGGIYSNHLSIKHHE
jgi:hypothetical protein